MRFVGFTFFVAALASAGAAQARLQVCTTTTDLAALARAVGGDQVEVVALAKGREDPHFVEARPSFIKVLNRADVFVQVGLELERGWAPTLVRSARNRHILPGAGGFIDASTAILPLNVPGGAIDRSMGDVHAYGNPHYLLDPLNGLRVAAHLRDRLAKLRPEEAERFQARYAAFAERLATALVGADLTRIYGADRAEKLAVLFEHGKLGAFLEAQGHRDRLAGWLGRMLPHHGAAVVDDHDLWPYFTRRFGLRVVAHLEPKPGIPPTTRHLGEVVRLMKARGVKVILASTYFNSRPARLVAEETGAVVVPMAHQVGARRGAADYVSLIDYNVGQVAAALAEKGS